MFRSLPLIILMLVLCCGCETPVVKDVQSWVGMEDEPEGRFIDRFKETEPRETAEAAESQAETAAAKDVATAEPAEPEPTIAIPEKALTGQRMSIGVARNQEIEAYLNSILARLQQAWPKKPVPSYVFLRPSPEFSAFSTDHAIFIDYGAFRAMESEDEAAALLAHEYSHILLNHQSLQNLSSLLGLAVEVYQTTASVKSRTSGNTENLLKDAVLSETADKLSQDAFIPVFSRENEEEADALGTDLLIAAGYSPMGMVNLLQRVASWEDDAAKRKEEAKKAEDEARKAANGGRDTFSLDKIVSDMNRATESISRQHYPATERIDTIKAYVRAQYAGTPRPALQSAAYQAVLNSKTNAPYFAGLKEMDSAKMDLYSEKQKSALKRIRSKQCAALVKDVPYIRTLDHQIASLNDKLSLATLESDCRRDDALLPDYKALMTVYEAKTPDKALAVADTAYESLGKPGYLLPALIRLNKKVGDDAKALSYFLSCKASGDTDLTDLCQDSLNTGKTN